MPVLLIEGEHASAKTTTAYTSPLKIVGFNFDLGVNALFGLKYDEYFKGLDIKVVKYKGQTADYKSDKGPDILIYELPQPVQLTNEKIIGCLELWEYFVHLYTEALLDKDVQTVVIDTATIARKVKIDAYLQELQEGSKPRKQLLQIEYGHPDGAIRNLYTFAAGLNKNLVVTHHLTDEYVRTTRTNELGEKEEVSMVTGNRIFEGVKDTYRFVDWAIRNNLSVHKGEAKLISTITKCRDNPKLQGIDIEDCTWNKLVSMIDMSLGGRLNLPRRQAREVEV